MEKCYRRLLVRPRVRVRSSISDTLGQVSATPRVRCRWWGPGGCRRERPLASSSSCPARSARHRPDRWRSPCSRPGFAPTPPPATTCPASLRWAHSTQVPIVAGLRSHTGPLADGRRVGVMGLSDSIAGHPHGPLTETAVAVLRAAMRTSSPCEICTPPLDRGPCRRGSGGARHAPPLDPGPQWRGGACRRRASGGSAASGAQLVWQPRTTARACA